jgi:replicative DNA helicase
MPPQRTLPYSEESERAVLGAILLDSTKLADIRSRLTPPDFYLERHQVLFAACLSLADGGGHIDLRTLQAHLELAKQWEHIGGIGYLAQLDLDLPDVERLAEYVEIVRDRSVRRALIKSASATIRDAASTTSPVSDLLTKLGSEADALLAGAVRSRWSGVGSSIDALLATIEDGQVEALQGLPTGFADYDGRIGGWLPGSLIVLAGRPGMGKTSAALDVVRHTAVARGLPVGVFSLEMRREELGLKLLGAEAEVPTRYLRAGHISSRQWVAVFQAARRLSSAPLIVDDTADLQLRDLEARARRLRAEHPGLALLVVDYLQLVTAGSRIEHRRQEVGLIARRLKALAGTLGLPVLALSQLNRDATKRADPRPNLGDLAESGEIEAHADAVIFVHRPEYYQPDDEELRGLAELIVAKHRHGATGTVELSWLAPITSFRALVRSDASSKGPDPF